MIASEWWTYELSDFLMFSARTWYRLMERHNAAWFPLQWVAMVAGGTTVAWLALGARRFRGSMRVALLLCAMAWLFVAWAFHAQRYAPINWAASYFALAFALQGLMLLAFAAGASERGQADAERAARPVAAYGAILLALLALAYPLLAPALGRPFTQSEWLGLMPDPTVLATLALLVAMRQGTTDAGVERWGPRVLAVVPLLWCAIAGATLWTLKASEWFVLPAAGLASIFLVKSAATAHQN